MYSVLAYLVVAMSSLESFRTEPSDMIIAMVLTVNIVKMVAIVGDVQHVSSIVASKNISTFTASALSRYF